MAKNQKTLCEGLAGESYCTVGNALGALYGTILLKMNNFDEK